MFIHSTSMCVSDGRSGWIRCVSPCTRSSATCMSVPQPNCAVISVDPRDVSERTRITPGTRRIASSSGRVTVGIMRAAGSSPASAITFTSGNVTEGKIADGRRDTE